MEVTQLDNLLLDERPLLVMPRLATLIGLNEAIVLQQVHYWLKQKEQRQQDYIDGHYWVYNTYEQWQEQFPFWSIMTIRRTITKLENKGLLIVGNHNKAGFDKTKWYSIDYATLYSLDSPSVQNEHIVCSNWYDGSVQNEQTNTIDYTENTFNVLNGLTLEQCNKQFPVKQNSFDWCILEKQIIRSCHKLGIQNYADYVTIIKYYYSMYMTTFHKEHPRLSNPAMDSVIKSICSGSELVDGTDPDMYEALISQHFKTQYDNCDYNICHFMSEGIRNNRFYETCY